MILIVAEKPSQGVDIANAIGANQRGKGFRYGNGYIVSWCRGHLLELAKPDFYAPSLKSWKLETLPIIPERMEYVVAASTEFANLKRLMERQDVTSLICATDAGREGEHIFRTVYQAAGCRKPWQRLWISSLTKESILQGMQNLQDGHKYDNLAAAAACRDQADWLLGLNYTRLYTKITDTLLHVGRVKTPTLALIVQRQQEIDTFQPEPYYLLSVQTEDGVTFSHRFSKDEAEQMNELLSQKAATMRVLSVKTTQRHTSPPRSFNLSALQQEANELFGLSAAQTLAELQVLYEEHLCGYPRTESEYITEDMVEDLPDLLDLLIEEGLLPELEFYPQFEHLVKTDAVHDHPALLPTKELTKERFDSMNVVGKQIMLLLLYRLLEACGSDKITEVTEVEAEVNGTVFRATAENVVDAGWYAYHEILLYILNGKKAEREKKTLSFHEGDILSIGMWSKQEKQTTPPKPYTEGTLLRAMETAGRKLDDADLKEAISGKGLGTAATRASIIEGLVKEGYVTRKQKNLIPSDKGKNLISVVTPELRTPALTAEWELRLGKVERGEERPEVFMHDLKAAVTETVRSVRSQKGQIPVFSQPRKRYPRKKGG